MVRALALQTDGKIIASGSFTTLGGQTRPFIGRLSVDVPATQNLTIASTGQAITWMRGGSNPEITRVAFELSTDGVTYLPLGPGTRIPGGWQLTGLALPFDQPIFVRARGERVGSFVESVRVGYLHVTRILLPVLLR